MNRPERLHGRVPAAAPTAGLGGGGHLAQTGQLAPAERPPSSDTELMHRVMDRVEQMAAAEFREELIHRPLFGDHRSPTRNFGVQGQNAVVSFFATTHDREGTGWWLNLNIGLGFEVSNIESALRWTNQENLKASTGRYYVSIAHHGEWCAVMWEHNLWSGLLGGLLGGSASALVDEHLRDVLSVARREANTTPYRVREYLGGRACPRGEQGVIWIFSNMY